MKTVFVIQGKYGSSTVWEDSAGIGSGYIFPNELSAFKQALRMQAFYATGTVVYRVVRRETVPATYKETVVSL